MKTTQNNKPYEFIISGNIEEIKSLKEYYWFCKIYKRHSNDERKINWDKKVINESEIKNTFKFVKDANLSKYKGKSFEIFSFEWLKDSVYKEVKLIKKEEKIKIFKFQNDKLLKQVKEYSNIYEKMELKNLINQLIPYFFLQYHNPS